ncbi:hypothetical protein [Lacinutrix sp. Hel_I_90]|uniref:hypothetical protein n=1 Tax=Lacinutrix sp. Hel_I_90 TaxID=1249999 RepID=UPI000A7D36F8|nr:hypothetical protein [Lacinutrix sp. Hel_I_90]
MRTIELTGSNEQKITFFIDKIEFVSDRIDEGGNTVIQISSKTIRVLESYKDVLYLINA